MMNIKNPRALIYVAAAILAIGIYLVTRIIDKKILDSPIVSVNLPDPGAEHTSGRNIYEENCMACHGAALGGVKGVGPPFIHSYYAPGHHSDLAFSRAVSQGVIAHHWQFGDMPPVKSINPDQSKDVIGYIRMVQRANGIY